MNFKAFTVGVLGLAAISPAAVITFTLVAAANTFTVSAHDSIGNNFGIASFAFTVGGTGTTIASVSNQSPRATYTPNDGISDTRTSGFTLLRSNSVTGSQDTVSGDGVRAYGIGQTPGTLLTLTPAGYTYVSGSPVYAAEVVLATGTFTGATPVLTSGAGNVFTTNSGISTQAASIVLLPEPSCIFLGASIGTLLRRRRSVAQA